VVPLVVVVLSRPALAGQLTSAISSTALLIVAVDEAAIVIGHAHVNIAAAHLAMTRLVARVFVGPLIHHTATSITAACTIIAPSTSSALTAVICALLALRFRRPLHLLVLLVRLLVALLVLNLAGVLLLEQFLVLELLPALVAPLFAIGSALIRGSCCIATAVLGRYGRLPLNFSVVVPLEFWVVRSLIRLPLRLGLIARLRRILGVALGSL
jgi:hypothetical protein